MIRNKFEVIREYIAGKDVLDCGCVGSNESTVHSSKFLHKMIAHNCKYVLGVDISVSGVQKLKECGYNVVYGNVETADFYRKFDVVIAGDLIEHLSNPGLFLENAKKHLKRDGVLIIHTPNPFGITRFYHMLTKKYVEVNSDHMCYYDIMTIRQALSRHGFTITEWYYTNTLKPPLFKKVIIDIFTMISEGFSDSIIVVAKPIEVHE